MTRLMHRYTALPWRTALGAAVLAVASLLSGCAAQRAHDEGLRLVANGDLPAGLERLETATRLAPDKSAYRLAWLQARDRRVQALVQEAQRLERQHRRVDARDLWEAVLVIDDRHERARAALAADHTTPSERQVPSVKGAVSPAQAAGTADGADVPARLAEAYRQPISLQFKEASLHSVFDVIARTSGLNILLDKDLRSDQKTSIHLKDSTIERALAVLMLTQQLSMRVIDDNSVLIYPNTPAKHKDHQPLEVASFYLAHAEAKAVAATLKSLIKADRVVVDEKLNLLIVRDTPGALHLARKLVALHDVAEPEVLLDVEIIEIKRSRLLNLGVRWPDQLSLTPLPSDASDTLRLSDLRNIDSASTGASVGALALNLRKTDGDANILANPRIRARNREKARILIGERVPNITATSTATGFVAESVNYVDVGLKLEVEPTVHVGDEVTIKVALEVSNIINQLQTKQGSVAFQIGTRSAQTVLRLRDGESQLLAGLINDEDRRSAQRVPGLGDLPILGRLFGSQSDDQIKTEIVLSITPRVLRSVRPVTGNAASFSTGTETTPDSRAPLEAVEIDPSLQPERPERVSETTQSPRNERAVAATKPVEASTPVWHAPQGVSPGQSFETRLVQPGGTAPPARALSLRFDPSVLQLVTVLPQAGSRVDPSGQVLLTTSSDPNALVTLVWKALERPGKTQVRIVQSGSSTLAGQPDLTSPPDLTLQIGERP